MRTKKYFILVIASFSFFVVTGQIKQVVGKAEPSAKITPLFKHVSEPHEILAGLPGVAIVVEDFEPGEERYGLTKQKFQTDVELRLRKHGVKVFSVEELVQVRGTPYLYVAVKPLIDKEYKIAAAVVSVELREETILLRNMSTSVRATTWSKKSVSLLGLTRFDTIREAVRDIIDIFINDYLAANPKE